MFEVKDKDGKVVRRLLTPSEKGKRFSEQLSKGVVDETGVILSDSDKAYRKGYLAARRDSADAYNAKHNPAKLAEDKAKRKEYRLSKSSGDKPGDFALVSDFGRGPEKIDTASTMNEARYLSGEYKLAGAKDVSIINNRSRQNRLYRSRKKVRN